MSSSSKKVIYAALIGNALIAISKFGAASFTGSSAMLSEGIHSLVDTGNQVLLLHGLKQAQKPHSAQFLFGHGKEEGQSFGESKLCPFLFGRTNKILNPPLTFPPLLVFSAGIAIHALWLELIDC